MVPSQVTSEARALHLEVLRREGAVAARGRRLRRRARRSGSPLRRVEELVLARRRAGAGPRLAAVDRRS
jgi:hypothetical protein